MLQLFTLVKDYGVQTAVFKLQYVQWSNFTNCKTHAPERIVVLRRLLPHVIALSCTFICVVSSHNAP